MRSSQMSAARASLALMLCATVAGCAVGPNYSRPSAPTSPTYKAAAGWSPAAPADALDRGDWWTLFGDPVLNDLEGRVQVSNQNIIAAEAAYRQARALVGQQRSALFPTVSLDGGATRTGGEGRTSSASTSTTTTNTGTTTGASRDRESYQASIGASWEVDVWGRIRRGLESARATAQASDADLAAARLSAQGEVATNYFGLRETDAELALTQQTVEGYGRTLQIAQNQFNAGVAPRSDVLQAQTQYSNAKADLAGLEQQRATYENAIAVLVGEAPGAFNLASATWTSTVPDIPAGVPSTLLQRRPDIAAAERRVASANAEIGVATAAFFPDLVLSGSYGTSVSALESLFSASNAIWSLGFSTAATLLDAGGRSAQVSGARAAYDQAVAQYREVVLEALQNVDNQLTATRVLAAQYELRKEASEAADAAERMVTNRYQAGQIGYIDVVTAQTSAATARRSLVLATAQRQTTAVALIQALGGGWRQDAPPGQGLTGR